MLRTVIIGTLGFPRACLIAALELLWVVRAQPQLAERSASLYRGQHSCNLSAQGSNVMQKRFGGERQGYHFTVRSEQSICRF